MEPGAFEFRYQTSKGDVIFRYPQLKDAPALLEYINALSRERTFITLQGEQKTLKEEQDWIASTLDNMANNQEVMIVAAVGQRIIGIASISLQNRTSSHIGSLAISVAEDYRNRGIGSILFLLINQHADQNLTGMRTVILSLFGTNHRAFHIYQRFGFTEHGRLPAGLCHRGEYVDEIFMHRPVAAK